MTATPDSILKDAEAQMKKASEYLKSELRGIRTGRATTSMVDMIKADYYGSHTEIKNMAAVSVPEPHQILIKPFDAASIGAIREAIEKSGIGLNPIVEAKQIRINVPTLDANRRKQLATQAKKLAEEQKVVCRNARRDANKHAEALKGAVPDDEIETLKEEIQEMLKKYEGEMDKALEAKTKDIMEV